MKVKGAGSLVCFFFFARPVGSQGAECELVWWPCWSCSNTHLTWLGTLCCSEILPSHTNEGPDTTQI